MRSYIAVFPGQGSQSVGMGKEFFDSSPAAQAVFHEANVALGYDLAKLCFEGPLEELTLTQNAQPAILAVSAAAYQALGLAPAAAAGHSLGEYSALVAAGAIRFSDAVALVHQRGKFMQEAVPAGEGKMIAVLGPTVDEIQTAIDAIHEGVAEIANMNCPGQTVVSGDVVGVERLSAALVESGKKVIPLNVSAPFHCSLMKFAEERLAERIAELEIFSPAFPVYSNVTARPHTTPDEIRRRLREQVCAPVRWSECIMNMVSDHEATMAVEFGAGDVLSSLLKRIDRTVNRLNVSTPESAENTRQQLFG